MSDILQVFPKGINISSLLDFKLIVVDLVLLKKDELKLYCNQVINEEDIIEWLRTSNGLD